MNERDYNKEPIPTIYDEHSFRSKIEAHWAYWFNLIGTKYDYEPAAWQVSPVLKYLPDFFFENVLIVWAGGKKHTTLQQLWVEVKGPFTDYDKEKVRCFAANHKIIVVRDIPRGARFEQDITAMARDDFPIFNSVYITGEKLPLIPGYVNGKLALFQGGKNSCCKYCNANITGEAYTAARMAKFDHGQTPGTDPLSSVAYDRRLLK